MSKINCTNSMASSIGALFTRHKSRKKTKPADEAM